MCLLTVYLLIGHPPSIPPYVFCYQKTDLFVSLPYIHLSFFLAWSLLLAQDRYKLN